MPDFDKLYPYCEMQEVQIDGQYLIKVPRFFVKDELANEGAAHAGKRTRWISDRLKTGYHLHPSFKKSGREMECFYYGAYEASNADDPNGTMFDSTSQKQPGAPSISCSGKQRNFTGHKAASLPNTHVWNYIFLEEARTACEARNVGGVEGFHITNIYEVDALALLILTEYGGSDLQALIGAGNSDKTWTTTGNAYGDDKTVKTGMSNAVWRGIHEMWGNVWEHVDGCYNDTSGKLYIWDKNGNQTYQATGVGLPSGGTLNSDNQGSHRYGYTVDTSQVNGENFDLRDNFFPSVLAADVADSTYNDYGQFCTQNRWGGTPNANYRPATHMYVSGSFPDGACCGPFARFLTYGRASALYGFRLGKYGDLMD